MHNNIISNHSNLRFTCRGDYGNQKLGLGINIIFITIAIIIIKIPPPIIIIKHLEGQSKL